MRVVTFQKLAFEQFTGWSKQNPRLFERLVRIIAETAREPFVGGGEPEPLKGNLKGHWSRRIDSEHRLVYCVTEAALIIVSCRDHYH